MPQTKEQIMVEGLHEASDTLVDTLADVPYTPTAHMLSIRDTTVLTDDSVWDYQGTF